MDDELVFRQRGDSPSRPLPIDPHTWVTQSEETIFGDSPQDRPLLQHDLDQLEQAIQSARLATTELIQVLHRVKLGPGGIGAHDHEAHMLQKAIGHLLHAEQFMTTVNANERKRRITGLQLHYGAER